MIKLEVGKRYLTRGGREVLITEEFKDMKVFKFQGVVDNVTRTWTPYGIHSGDDGKNPLDIVREVPPPFVPGNFYRTRGGKKVFVAVRREDVTDYPLIGWEEGRIQTCWTLAGQYVAGADCPEDLVGPWEELSLAPGRVYETRAGDRAYVGYKTHGIFIGDIDGVPMAWAPGGSSGDPDQYRGDDIVKKV